VPGCGTYGTTGRGFSDEAVVDANSAPVLGTAVADGFDDGAGAGAGARCAAHPVMAPVMVAVRPRSAVRRRIVTIVPGRSDVNSQLS
jgi:hypothetical protein